MKRAAIYLEPFAYKLFAILVFCLFVSITACGPRTAIIPADREILLDPSCKMPCWREIKPGLTTKSDFYKLLGQTAPIKPTADQERLQGDGKIVTTWYVQKGSPYKTLVIAYVQDDIVEAISIAAASQITLREIVQALGEPDTVQLDSGYIGNHQAEYDVTVFYPQQGLVIHFERVLYPNDLRPMIEPSLREDEITLLPLGTTQELVTIARKFAGQTSIGRVAELPLQDWHGYGNYEILPH